MNRPQWLAVIIVPFTIGILFGALIQERYRKNSLPYVSNEIYGKALWVLHERCVVCMKLDHTPNMQELTEKQLKALSVVAGEPDMVFYAHGECLILSVVKSVVSECTVKAVD